MDEIALHQFVVNLSPVDRNGVLTVLPGALLVQQVKGFLMRISRPHAAAPRTATAVIDAAVRGGRQGAGCVEGAKVGTAEQDVWMRLEIAQLHRDAIRPAQIVGIEQCDVFAPCRLHAHIPRHGNTRVGLPDHAHSPRISLQELCRAIGGAVVHDHDIEVGVRLGKQTVECLRKGAAGVIRRDDHGNQGLRVGIHWVGDSAMGLAVSLVCAASM